MQDKIRHTAITFDDVLIEPRYSEVVPSEVEVSTQLTRRIGINIPLISSPMDTVTESAMAIGLAKVGGLGVKPQNYILDKPMSALAESMRPSSLNSPTEIVRCRACDRLSIKSGISVNCPSSFL